MTWGADTDPEDAAAQLKTYVEVGGNLIDTADVYGDGLAEEVIGGLLDNLVPRDDVLIATKAGLRPGMERRHDTSRGHILRALDASLRRLGTDHVDVWQVHGFDTDTPLDETLSALDYAVTSGRVRYVGVSNFSGWQTAQAATWQTAWPGRAPIVSVQVEYSLVERGIEREVIPACEAFGLGVLPWSPLGRGVLTGKYRNGRPADSRGASPHFERFVAPYLDPRCSAIVESVVTAAAGLGVSPVEVASGLGTGPARRRGARCSAHVPWASCSRPCRPRRSRCRRRSAGRWTTSRRSAWATPNVRGDGLRLDGTGSRPLTTDAARDTRRDAGRTRRRRPVDHGDREVLLPGDAGQRPAGLPPPEQNLACAVAKEFDLGQLPVGELGGDGELRRRGGPIDVAGYPQRRVFVVHHAMVRHGRRLFHPKPPRVRRQKFVVRTLRVRLRAPQPLTRPGRGP